MSYRGVQYPTHAVIFDKDSNTVRLVRGGTPIMHGDDVVDQNDRVGDLSYNNVSKVYTVIWKDGSPMSELHS